MPSLRTRTVSGWQSAYGFDPASRSQPTFGTYSRSPSKLDGIGDGEGRHGAVPGLEAGFAFGLGILEVSLVGIG